MDEQKLLELVKFTRSFHFGSLWWIKDVVWKLANPNFVVKNSRRKHPGICINQKKIQSLYQTLPMLLGSHSCKNGLWVQNLSEKSEKREKIGKGYFAIRPYGLALFHTIGSVPGIEANNFKPMLSDEEKEELKTMLLKKGIMLK